MRTVAALWRSGPGRLGLILSALIVTMAGVSLAWTPHDPRMIDPARRWQGWSLQHLLGTDGSGKDILSQLLAGARISLTVVAMSVAVAAAIGLALGVAAAALPRTVGSSVTAFIDTALAIPSVVLALVLVAALGASPFTVSLAIGTGAGVALARVVRLEASRVLTSDFVRAARGCGASTRRTTFTHVLPNVAPIVVVQLSVIAAFAVLSEASLSYLGLTSATDPSWGRMLQTLQQTITIHPWHVLAPGAAVVAATLGFNLLGDGIRDAIDPHRRTPSERVEARRAPS